MDFEKNRLDLAYKRQLAHLNAVLLLFTIGLLPFLGTFIWDKENFTIGFIIATIIFLIAIFWYKRINDTLKKISKQIKKLSKKS